ncbi:MAG: SLBB domain-containing protein [Candidatus Kapaibacterium sp.]|nr:SLBB domain-containing protein [Ignavibacteriota bacterium]MCB9221087.1 SLBB domain-containing protein [Ignavibacteria bacterium]
MKFKIIIAMLLSTTGLLAQITGMSESNSVLKSEIENNKGMDSQMFETEQMPVSNVINPDYYYLGPGDVLMIKAIPMLTTPVPVVVSPDNMILLPRSGGLIDVNGKTLTEVRKLIEENITKYKSDAIVTTSFHKPHLSFVEVEGNVLNSSVYNLPSTFKVSDAIHLANKRGPISEKNNASEDTYIQERLRVKKSFSRNQDNSEIVEYWKRNILVIHEDGTSTKVDLIKAKSSGNGHLNPYVRQGDRIIVPFNRNQFGTISISGEVNRPITLPYKNGDKLSELIEYSLGLTSFADTDNIYLFDNGVKTKLNSKDGKIIIENDRELSPGAIVIAGNLEERKSINEGVVTIRGFVNNPGAYPIINSKTKLSEIIEQAGGITEGAYLPLAKLYRKTNEFDELSESRTEAFKMFRKSNLSLEDTVRYTLDIHSIEPIVSVDFTKVLNSSNYDVTLENGDEIVIPTSPNRVYVFGRVENPGYVEFEEGKNLLYYINKTGGFTDVADEDRAAVIRKNTSSWIDNEESIVYDGDYIYVPGEVDVSTSTEQAKVSTYAAIGSIILSLGFLIVNIVNTVNK